MSLSNKKIDLDHYFKQRDSVLLTWPTGRDVNFEEALRLQSSLPDSKRFSKVLMEADRASKTLRQPRCGVALLDEMITLLQGLEPACDLLTTTIDAYTRNNRYQEAEDAIKKSISSGKSLLNGHPGVNHGVFGNRRLIESISKPIQVRHGTPDARLLCEISLASGFTSFEGGGITYNIPYSKRVPLERSIQDWQYCDRLIGIYEENGIRINREPFAPMSATLVLPFISHAVVIAEALMMLSQGVRSITLSFTQGGNIIQDIAAMQSLRELGHEYFQAAGFTDYELTTVFHQWMGGFPENESMAFSVICLGSTVAALSRATKVMIKTPHEARGVPTMAANLQGIDATSQALQMVKDQVFPPSQRLDEEKELIKREVRAILDAVYKLGNGDIAIGTVRAFAAGVLDVPFVPSIYNAGKMLPVRDNEGFLRVLEKGAVPLPDDVLAYHRDKIEERVVAERRPASFQMVLDDVYAISKGNLVGRPEQKQLDQLRKAA